MLLLQPTGCVHSNTQQPCVLRQAVLFGFSECSQDRLSLTIAVPVLEVGI